MPPSLLPPTPEELEELRLRRRASQLKGYGEGVDDPTAQALLNVRRNLGEAGRAVVGAKPYDETNPTGSYRAVQALMNAPTPAAIIPEAAQAAGKAATALSGLGALGVVKPKGGNWLAGSIERTLKPMKNDPIISGELIDAASGRELFKEYQQSYKKDPTVGLVEWTRKNHPEVYDDLLRPEEAAINNWIDTKLGKYIKNEMATPEDPVRALAERGVLHVDPEAGLYHGRRTVHPSGEVFDKLGQSEAAKSWENASDYMVSSSPAEIYQNFGSSNLGLDWVNKLDPSTPFYRVRNTAGPELGFNHLIDELTNAASPDSDLPRSLQLSPEKLQKVTVPQAVELVDKINKWRAEEAVKAERAGMLGNLQATPRITDDSFQLSFVGKPGGAWVDIPETVTDKGMKLCSSIGKAGGWCTQAEWAAKSYGSGENRLTALVDAEGRPHAQAKITSIVDDTGAFDAVIDDLTPAQEAAWDAHFGASNGPPELREALGWLQEHAPNVYKKYQDVLASQPKEPPDITELKPVGNSFKSERAQEYGKRDPEYFRKVENAVLNFLNNGQWGKVKDLDLYGIVDLQRDPVMLLAYLRDITKQDSRAAQALFNQAVDRNPNAPRFMTGRQLREFVKPTEGYAAGGAVRMKKGGAVTDPNEPEVKRLPEPGLLTATMYAETAAREMYPKDPVKRDAARHMIASSILGQKLSPGTSRLLGELYEFKTSPLLHLKSAVGLGAPPPGYEMDKFNNALGSEMQFRNQAELQRGVRQAVDTGRARLTPDEPAPYRRGGAVKIETNPTLMADELLFKGYRR